MTATASEATRHEYAARMNRVVDHIQSHLAEPLNLERLAAIACFSPFHFHRLFSAWMGETLQAHVQRLRLERAAKLLSFDRRKTITEVALDCGFSSSSAFARAFKQAYGLSGSEWRKRKICQTNRKSWEAEQEAILRSSAEPGPMARPSELPMARFPIHVQVRHLEPATLAYIRHIGSYKGNAALFRRLFDQLFAWAGPRGLMGPEARYLSLFQDNPNLTPAAKQRLEVALTVPPGTAPDGPIGIKPLEGGLYAIARVRVLPHEYADPWETLVGAWLPASGYQPDGRPALEIYLNNPDTDPEGRFELEICFPVRPL
ncbi:GyrI-like domain-containing protein [Geothrix sp. PMB-07]|uniref:AraC family transcriptional regulator n=1 Tax=Geothrix sp. PMB-07 TaxID=3068640 RepID=UPI0027427C7A|nr:GyrI-like domain-containing protein [Geothrix sp. PMB-07]WLT32168.1 GyrI-like domain-containing protein [Geothrix sp. PMB-07]